MKRRDVFIDVDFGQMAMANFKTLLLKVMKDPQKKAILYENFRTTVLKHYDEIRDWLDENKLHDRDVVMVHGDMDRFEKFYYINVFTGKDKIRIPVNKYSAFNSRLLLGTESVNAGVDDHLVFLVFHIGLVNCIFNFIQEWGRAHRRIDVHPDPRNDSYVSRFHLHDFVSMIRQIGRMRQSNGILDLAKAKEYMIADLMEITLELVLPISCFHQRFEWMASNPFERPTFAESG
jgi:hypothetical protein